MKSTAPILDGVISTRTHTDGGQKVVQQVVHCNVPGCNGEMAATVTKSLKPGDQVLNMASRRGWRIEGDGRKVCACPAHKAAHNGPSAAQIADLADRYKAWFRTSEPMQEKRKVALIEKLAELGLAKVTETKTQYQREALLAFLDSPHLQEPPMAQKNPELVASSLGLVPLSESLKLPSDAARAQRRKVFHEIDDAYENGRYKTGVTDQTIAAKLVVAVSMVAEIREQNFGPAGPDPRIVDLERKIAALMDRIEGIETAGLKAMEHAEAMAKQFRSDMQDLQNRLVELKGKL